MLEDEVFDYLNLFCADTQPQELRALRELALTWMERLQVFRPHLSGAVWRGSATRLSDIYIQLFCDDAKSAELMLIDQGVRYEVQAIKGFKGEEVDALSIHSLCTALNEDIGVHLMVYDYDDLRGALQPDERGLAVRGDLASLRQLLDNA
jgi:ABC-type cobalamin transport system ATPase subunit